MQNSELARLLIAKVETSNSILMKNLPIARSVVRILVPEIMIIFRRELDGHRREFEAKERRRNAGA